MNGKTIATSEGAERGMFDAERFDEKERKLLERLSRAAEDKVISKSGPKVWEMIAIYKLLQTDSFNALRFCFAYGFIKGQRAERNRAKRVQADKPQSHY